MDHLPIPTFETAKKLGLLLEEFDQIKKILGRAPNFTELSIYSVMWSEHCSYKNSIVWLKKLPKDSSRMLAKAGEENAGLVDIGDGLAVSFKIESHNHPSAIEPYQGAATGVGGINRDIFTMGARPIAQLNSLRFGNLKLDRTRWLLKRVVKGIGDYGNAFGVPTVGGEIFFDDSFNVNPLVNALSVGIVHKDKIARAISYGVGNSVFIVGSATGKDGIHGATFASEDITAASAEKLPAVQVGDPFQEKLLLEATLEAIATGFLIGVQDMGAAGIICSTSEMSAKGNHGMEIWLDRVPTRQSGMMPWEILLSESQERMLLIVQKGHEEKVQAIMDKWDLSCAQIGVVTDTKRLRFYTNGQLIADVPAESLVLGGGAPVYYREYKEPSYYKDSKKFSIDKVSLPSSSEYISIARFLLTHPNIASKRWVYEQYDSMVGTVNRSIASPSDAAIVDIKNTTKALALKIDCNSRYVQADPKIGCAIAVAESARNVVCSGAEPIAITNCLNFGNPYVPEVYWQFVQAIEGMKMACEKFETPVTGGNVSFYNQSSDEGPVFPTPTIGMLGLLEDKSFQMTLNFKNPGDSIFLIGQSKNCINSSEYLYSYHHVKSSPAPAFDLEEEYQIHHAVKQLIQKKVIASAHDVSDGGLFIALMESAMVGGLGFSIQTDVSIRKDAFLFGESQSRVVVSVTKELENDFKKTVRSLSVPFFYLGQVIKHDYKIDEDLFFKDQSPVQLYENALGNLLGI